ncbi:hypothetical protein BD626DRAFT_515884 [Schizophyllum amplum]|uniref:Peptidase M20 dimerisation domain-containing protein n=1 Tax=Schizophyllum amplum TaxID=97359 RepID=A0A550BXG8_9AGAR|nr:hypothetical protein BD626DRAFT_515884 [Auriculariopsis ampla]
MCVTASRVRKRLGFGRRSTGRRANRQYRALALDAHDAKVPENGRRGWALERPPSIVAASPLPPPLRLAGLALGGMMYRHHVHCRAHQERVNAMLEEAQCPVQPSGLRSAFSQWPSAGLSSSDKELYVQRLSKAIQLDTVSYDDMYETDPTQAPEDGGDPRWLVHERFNKWKEQEWPLVYTHMQVEYITKYSTILTLPGRDPTLPPVLLMSHQDTVPVQEATVDEWDQPPFSGIVTAPDARGRHWMSLLVSELNALERVIRERLERGEDVRGERTVVMSVGFDEEVMGIKGAGNNSLVLQERYGQDSFAFIIDEGSTGIESEYGLKVASLGLSEKGSLGAKIEVDVPGGHASKPPRHTGLGILSLLIAALEAHPNPHTLHSSSLYLRYLTCLAQHAPDMPSDLRKRILDPAQWPALADSLAESDELRAHIGTTMAANVARAGAKTNALPEHSEAIVDSRVGWDDTVADVQARYAVVMKEKSWWTASRGGGGSIAGREHAPITPSEGPVWELMAGVVRHVWGENVVVAPKGMIAAEQNIFRFRAVPMDEGENVHTVNERVTDQALFGITQYVYELLVNLEGWRE